MTQIYSIFTPDSYQSMPWKNGLGRTVEILKQDLPDNDDFAWRLSMADVTQDGEFSNFSGYDRTLLLLEGGGMTLEHASGKKDELLKPLDTARFKGDEPTFATLNNGPIKDFNVMTFRQSCSADVIGCNELSGLSIGVNSDVVLIYAVGDRLNIESQSLGILTIPEQHLLRADRPDSEEIRCHGAPFIVIQIRYGESL